MNNEHDPIWKAAYLAAQTMRDKTLSEKERNKRLEQSVYMVEEVKGSFTEYHQLLTQALQFTGEQQKGI